MKINVIGAGLAGCEAAWQIAKRNIPVTLYDMKPVKFSPAHKSKDFAELVCSNSFKAARVDSAAGLLKEELRRCDSFLMMCADKSKVPAGGALAVDRDAFSRLVTQYIEDHPLITIRCEEVKYLDSDSINVISTGPLTSDSFAEYISELCGDMLSFYDAAAPIVTRESIDMRFAFEASRYGKGNSADYLNCPMEKDEYETFYTQLRNAQRAKLHEFDKVYEGCMPIEIMAMRGEDTMRFGPMKPVGIYDPVTGKRPWAILQMRKENVDGTLYNLVGCQTNLTFLEQKRVFGLIPALHSAEFVRYGVMHRNTFIDSPKLLDATYAMRQHEKIFFAGQITGVEGYMESTSSGLVAGINAVRLYGEEAPIVFPKETMIGALSLYVSQSQSEDFQPMGANFGIIPSLEEKVRDKRERYAKLAERSLKLINGMKDSLLKYDNWFR